jgi:hypothetical protein
MTDSIASASLSFAHSISKGLSPKYAALAGKPISIVGEKTLASSGHTVALLERLDAVGSFEVTCSLFKLSQSIQASSDDVEQGVGAGDLLLVW